ncbi:hypothetical protein Slin15195_G030220 [Septoria linicola]|uniref:Uncharacterized protein n=1 Tax=Septoria linicola TaxID=215465 RepID=A0A9Q9AML0_9PEZI|nr:hypothetical protein Slin14017_G029240 [Septoria linicola]USW49703.1 hypothetical protein Slin15195_G030220 [Septoria linicola]
MTDAVTKLRAITQALELCQVCESRVTGEMRKPQQPESSILDLPIPELDQQQSCKTKCDRGAGKQGFRDACVESDISRASEPGTPISIEKGASTASQPTSSPESVQQPTNDVFYKRCFISDVHVIDSSLQAFTIKDCDLDGVTFLNCNFSDVLMEDLKLKNVSFVNVDFRRVWLRNINWICALWDGNGLTDAFVTGYNFGRDLEDEKRPKLVLSLKTESTTKHSKTRVLHPARAKKAKAVQDGESKIVCQEARLGLLQLPDKVMDAILGHLFPRSSGMSAHAMMVNDLPTSALRALSSQQTYKTRSPFGFVSTQFTYHGWPYPTAITSAGDAQQHETFRLGFCLPFLLVSKRCYQLAIPHIYDRRLYFDDKPERCIAFLKDHQAPEHKMLAIALRYSSQTNPDAWRQLLEALLNDKEAINELTVELSSEFWSSSIWRGKCWPESLIGWKGWNGMWQQQAPNEPKHRENSFLELVAKLPGSRLQSGQVPRKAEDVRFFFEIQRAKGSPSREAFVDEVQMKLRIRMLAMKET